MIAASSDAAYLAVVTGLFFIYGELCAPGLVVPGSIGSMLVLGGGWLLGHKPVTLSGATLLACGVLLLWFVIARRWSRFAAGAAVFCLCAGSAILIRRPEQISPLLAISLSLAFGGVTLMLGRLAVRARRLKRV